MSKKTRDNSPEIDFVRLSRAVAHALRHEPWLYELELDDEGWTGVDALVAALRRESPAWSELRESDLAEMIQTASKPRYEMAGHQIRALYGHSVPGRLRKTPSAPPEVLYHGTAPSTVLQIKQNGLLPMSRQYVHLSVDSGTAVAVGRRKSRAPVILTVRAHEAWEAGVQFYSGNEKVWLADLIPPEFIDFA
jgi:putative RNA 2'-phosphotransferase